MCLMVLLNNVLSIGIGFNLDVFFSYTISHLVSYYISVTWYPLECHFFVVSSDSSNRFFIISFVLK
jgi:hypothetical protein